MYKVLFVCVCAFSLLPPLDGKRELPSYLKLCKRTDPKLDACLKDAIENLKPRLGKGMPELKIPPFDPFHVIKLTIDNGQIVFNLSDMYFKNVDNFELNNVHLDLDKCSLELDLTHPIFEFSGNYGANGKILTFELNSEGQVLANMTSPRWTFTSNCKREKKRNEEYLIFTDMSNKLNVKEFHAYLSDLFKDNPQLTETTNAALNSNQEVLIGAFGQLLATGIGEVWLSVLQSVFNKFSVDTLLPK